MVFIIDIVLTVQGCGAGSYGNVTGQTSQTTACMVCFLAVCSIGSIILLQSWLGCVWCLYFYCLFSVFAFGLFFSDDFQLFSFQFMLCLFHGRAILLNRLSFVIFAVNCLFRFFGVYLYLWPWDLWFRCFFLDVRLLMHDPVE